MSRYTLFGPTPRGSVSACVVTIDGGGLYRDGALRRCFGYTHHVPWRRSNSYTAFVGIARKAESIPMV